MNSKDKSSRRRFLTQIGATGLVTLINPIATATAQAKAEERIMKYNKKFSTLDTIRLGVIGYGVQGHFDLDTALRIPGVELAGICDLYLGRLENAKELFGKELYTTTNYKDLLDREDIDAVIIATNETAHFIPISLAIERNLSLFIEKPLAVEFKQSKELLNKIKLPAPGEPSGIQLLPCWPANRWSELFPRS